MTSTNKIIFNTHLFKGNSIPSVVTSLNYFNEKIENTTINNDINTPNLSLSLVPSYIKLHIKDTTIKHKIIAQNNWGYAIHLDSDSTIDTYLQRQFKSKYRSIIRRYINRLEACFSITYKLYYGDISKDTYEFIFNSLKEMIVNRFKQRNEENKELYKWDILLDETYEKIKNKQASLFVIYDEDKPIEISLNYHFGSMLFSTISSYDINYSKFGLGHVEIYKQVEWCCANNYLLYEMGVGGMDYKRRWSDTIYNFEHHITYSKVSLLSIIKGRTEVFKIKLKENLKAKKINEIIPTLKNKFLKSKQFKEADENITVSAITKTNNTEQFNLNNLKEIAIDTTDYNFFKKYVYDFAYTTTKHVDTIKTYIIAENNYLIMSENQYQKISKK